MPKIFPDPQSENKIICVTGVGAGKDFSALIVKNLPNRHLLDTGQCFPLYHYENSRKSSDEDTLAENPESLFWGATPKVVSETPTFKREDAITDTGLAHFQETYSGEAITKEDLFYYIYGLLHSPEYRAKYADNLTKELPRIPRVKTAAAFWSFSKAGRELAEWHLNYETVACYPVKLEASPNPDYRVEKMRFGKDKSSVVYNAHFTMTGIPLKAYDYVVNGKSALEWVMERQGVTTHKESGIVNDANLWAVETMNNPRYPLELFQRVITVSLETMRIVKGLPGLEL